MIIILANLRLITLNIYAKRFMNGALYDVQNTWQDMTVFIF